MHTIANFVADSFRREEGATVVEYAVVLALIVVLCFSTLTNPGFR
jgi:Flp pilus assembly pilin Flp